MFKKMLLTAALMLAATGAQAAVVGPDTINNNANQNVNTNAQQQGQAQFQGQILNSNNEAFSVSGSRSDSDARSNATNSLTVTGDTFSYKEAASSAASLYGSECTTGASAQGAAFGLSVQDANQVCLNIMLSKNFFGMAAASKDAEKGAVLYNKGIDHLTVASDLVMKTNGVSLLDSFAKKITWPAAIIGILFAL